VTQAANRQPSSDDLRIEIGEQTYGYNDLSDDARRLIVAIKEIEAEVAQKKRQISYMEIARRSLIQELLVNLPSDAQP
jgi:hypothetical protein